VVLFSCQNGGAKASCCRAAVSAKTSFLKDGSSQMDVVSTLNQRISCHHNVEVRDIVSLLFLRKAQRSSLPPRAHGRGKIKYKTLTPCLPSLPPTTITTLNWCVSKTTAVSTMCVALPLFSKRKSTPQLCCPAAVFATSLLKSRSTPCM
jgi:hypothetical protein